MRGGRRVSGEFERMGLENRVEILEQKPRKSSRRVYNNPAATPASDRRSARSFWIASHVTP